MEFDVGKVTFQVFKKDHEFTYKVKKIPQEVHLSKGILQPKLLA